MKLIALKDVKYAGVLHKAGDEFEAQPKDAKLLSRVTRLKDENDPTLDEPRKRFYRRRDMAAEGERGGRLKFQQPPAEPAEEEQKPDTSVEPLSTRDFPSTRE